MIDNMLGILDILDTRQLYIAILKYLDIRNILVVKLVNHRNLIVKPILFHRILLALPSLLGIHAFRRVRPVFHKLNPYNPLVAPLSDILNHLDIVKQDTEIYIDVVADIRITRYCRDSIRRKVNVRCGSDDVCHLVHIYKNIFPYINFYFEFETEFETIKLSLLSIVLALAFATVFALFLFIVDWLSNLMCMLSVIFFKYEVFTTS